MLSLLTPELVEGRSMRFGLAYRMDQPLTF